MPTEVERRWKTLGFELEGGWDVSDGEIEERAPCRIHGDGSVNVQADGYVGEVVSERPYSRLSAAISAMERLWPEHVNESCGFHLHVGFTAGDYGALTDRAFYDYFLEQWEAWGRANLQDGEEPEFWNRLNGRNRYAKKEFHPDKQMPGRDKNGHRYTQLNYCWGRFKTIECRLLPMFERSELGIAAVKHLLWIYDSYLASLGDTVTSDEIPAEEHVPLRAALTDDLLTVLVTDEVEEVDDPFEMVLATEPPSGPIILRSKDEAKNNERMMRELLKKYPNLRGNTTNPDF